MPQDLAQYETRRRWVHRSVSAALVILGIGVGWIVVHIALDRVAGTPLIPPVRAPKPHVEKAVVVQEPPALWAAVGDEVRVEWQVVNIGETTWAVDRYRFSPIAGELEVLALPAAVPPGRTVSIKARLMVPATSGIWRVAWTLTGATGEVPGGQIEAAVTIDPP